MGASKNKITKNVKGIFFKKRYMYTLYMKGYEEQCQITIFNKTWISVAFNLFRMSDYHICFLFLFFAKREISFEFSTFRG